MGNYTKNQKNKPTAKNRRQFERETNGITARQIHKMQKSQKKAVHITLKDIKCGDLSEAHVNNFLLQFTEARRLEMTGAVIFMGNMFHEGQNLAALEDQPEKHKRVFARASSFIGHFVEKYVCSMTDIYANDEVIDREELTEDELFIAGYTSALSYYAEATNRILTEQAVFKGKDSDYAKQFYMALGMELADKLRAYTEDPDTIPIHCEAGTSPLPLWVS